MLFATLEPCVPGSRGPPKLGCAERIVLARIKEVWIGIEDPDPTVDRKGIRHLQDSGVTVHMFDRDLQEEIQQANKAFIEQALERAAAAREEKKPKTVTLSSLEDAFATAETKDLSTEAMKQYRTIAKISDTVGSPAFNRRLVQQGLLSKRMDNGPRQALGFCSSEGSQERSCLRLACWARSTLPTGPRNRRTSTDRRCSHPSRRFNGSGTSCQTRSSALRRGDGRRMRRSSSWFAKVSSMRSCTATTRSKAPSASWSSRRTPSRSRARQAGGTDHVGTDAVLQRPDAQPQSGPALCLRPNGAGRRAGAGAAVHEGSCRSGGTTAARFAWEAPYLVLTLYRSAAGAVRDLSPEVLDHLNADEKASWQFIVGRESVTSPVLMKEMGFDERKAQRVLKALLDSGLLRRVGRGRATRYEVVRR